MLSAPILDSVEISASSVIQNGALRENEIIWRKDPSPEVDAAWDRISTEGFELIVVKESDVIRSGKDPQRAVQAPISWGYGGDAYLAQIDVFHLIHCLNELRKEMHFDYYYGTQHKGQPSPEVHVSHKKHCLHMVLHHLMCHADTETITHEWVYSERAPDPKTRPYPDFNIVKQCRNFDSLLEWATKNAVKDMSNKFRKLRIPFGTPFAEDDSYA